MPLTAEHVEVDAVHRGMPVVLDGQEIGVLEDLIPQPDHRHILRLITRCREPAGRRVPIPIEWVRGIEDGRIELWVSQRELGLLPEYVPALSPVEARARVQRALDEHPATAGAVRVTDRDHVLELSGSVADPETRRTASEVARSVPGVGVIRNLLGTRAETGQQASRPVSPVGYGYPWLHDLLERASGLDFEDAHIARVEDLAERKLVDMFDVAEETAAANGRARILRQDLPVTKGLQILLLEVADLAREMDLKPLLVFLADAGIRAPFDADVREEIPRLMAALLMLTGRIIVQLPRVPSARPSQDEIDCAAALLDLTL